MPPLSHQQFEVDINRATMPELKAIPSIGPKMAERIDDYRSLHGPFSKIEDLLQVRGIGESLLEKMRPHLRVGSSSAESVDIDNIVAIE